MSAGRKTPSLSDATTIAWFEREIVAHTPQHSILDATSLGVWTIAEHAGLLAGAWKQHRILLQDLNTEQVATTLGALLGAIALTAHAVGIPLEVVLQQQVERVHMTSLPGSRQRHAQRATKPPAVPRAETVRVSATSARDEVPNASVDVPVGEHRRRGRPRKELSDADVVLVHSIEAPALAVADIPHRVKRG